MLMLWLVGQSVEREAPVIVFDMENGLRIVSERLGALGSNTAKIDELYRKMGQAGWWLRPLKAGVPYRLREPRPERAETIKVSVLFYVLTPPSFRQGLLAVQR
jgi:hypothetical protein